MIVNTSNKECISIQRLFFFKCYTRISDKFAAMRSIWDQFIENCQSCFVPGDNITVDEQLFPSKARCGFTQYMASKPDKFGIKFWIAADLKTKYFLNGYPYLGKSQYRNR